MTDEPQTGFEDGPSSDPLPRGSDESIDIAWGLVAFIVFLALLGAFVIQNGNFVAIEFLWLDFRIRVWLLLVLTVLLTLTFDQVISLLYRRRKRQAKRAKADLD